MSMDRAYLNFDGGNTVCCWEAPTLEALQALFTEQEVPFATMFPVEEEVTEALIE